MKVRLFVLAALIVALAASITGLTVPATTAEAQAAAPKGYVRIIHAAPGAPAVDLYLDGASKPAVTKLEYGKATPFLSLDAKTYRVAIRKAGDPATAAAVFQTSFSVSAGRAADVVAMGLLGKSDDTAFVVRQFPLDISATDKARVYVYHASPDAPAVDILGGGQPIIRGLSFSVASRPREVDPGSYSFDVTATKTTTPAVLKIGPVDLKAGHVYVLVAAGLVKEAQAFSFDALAMAADKVEAKPYTGKVSLVHAALGIGAVDVYLNGASKPAVAALAPGANTDWLSLTSAEYSVQLRPAGSPAINLPTYEGTLKVAPNSASVVVALGKVGGEPAFALKSFAVDLSKPAGGKGRVYAIQAGASAASLDIRVNGKVVLPDFKFGTITEKALEVDPGPYTITGVATGTRSPVLVSLVLSEDSGYGSVAAGNVYIVVPYGDLSGTPIIITVENK